MRIGEITVKSRLRKVEMATKRQWRKEIETDRQGEIEAEYKR